jgi:hypothetical protein
MYSMGQTHSPLFLLFSYMYSADPTASISGTDRIFRLNNETVEISRNFVPRYTFDVSS